MHLRQLAEIIESALAGEQLNIADVGATGGPELRWRPWEKFCFFYTFDPDSRAKPWNAPSQNFPIGLWSHRCKEQLHLAAFQPATSLFKPNAEFLRPFPTEKLLQETGKETIQLDILDRVLAEKRVDFIKIDAEGAELEILRGGTQILSQQCLGIQLETLFSPIRHNAPLFSDLDTFVRHFDFELFHIEREHWLRSNSISTYDSAPQLIWGNTLYLLSKASFLKRIQVSPQPEKLFAKYVLILFAYHLYDYAYEICEAIPSPAADTIKSILKSLPHSFNRLFPLLLSLLVGSGRYLFSFSQTSKKDHREYLYRKIRELGQTCLYLGRNDFALYD